MLPGLQPLFVEVPNRHREPRPEPRPILEGGGHFPAVPAAAAHWDFTAKVIFFKKNWIDSNLYIPSLRFLGGKFQAAPAPVQPTEAVRLEGLDCVHRGKPVNIFY